MKTPTLIRTILLPAALSILTANTFGDADSPAASPSATGVGVARVAKSKQAPKVTAKHTPKVTKMIITGSNIPTQIEEGKPLITSCQVVIIDTQQIRRTGVATAGQLMSLQSLTR